MKPGQALWDAARRVEVKIRADGLVSLGAIAGSIHKIGALAQGLPACNGWTYWHVEEAGKLRPLDDIRQRFRAAGQCPDAG